MELSIVTKIDEEVEIEVPKMSNKLKCVPSNPVEDRTGRPRWVRTRICYCLPDSKDPCQLNSKTTCPSEKLDKSKRTDGIQMWATNPDFNKPFIEVSEKQAEPTDDEIREQLEERRIKIG